MTSRHMLNRCEPVSDGHRAIPNVCVGFQKLGNDVRISGNWRNFPLRAPGHKADPVAGLVSAGSSDRQFSRGKFRYIHLKDCRCNCASKINVTLGSFNLKDQHAFDRMRLMSPQHLITLENDEIHVATGRRLRAISAGA